MVHEFPTPHGDKLKALIENQKLPLDDFKHIEEAIKQY
jgi:hypothetical protein